jgi:serine/threonine protein kinase
MMEKIGKYEIIRSLGRGATAIVYLAWDPDLQRQVAIKLIHFGENNAAMSRRLRKLFQTEDAIGRRLDHPNIVRIYDAVVEAEQAYLVMEFVDGPALDKFCAINRLLPMHRVIGIIFKCCLALDHAFRRGVVHRDIKPANILIDANDNPKITDFGLGLNLQKDMGKDSTFVMGVGSPAYMSPEQVKNYPLNHKTDLYSLGVLLFQLLTGRLPFRANNAADAGLQDRQHGRAFGLRVAAEFAARPRPDHPESTGERSLQPLPQWRRVRQGSVTRALPDAGRRSDAAGSDTLRALAQPDVLRRVRGHRACGKCCASASGGNCRRK